MNRRKMMLGSAAALVGAGAAHAQIVTMPFGGTVNFPRKSIVDLRFTNVVRQQFDLSCGAAAVATLLTHYYNDPVDEKTVIEGAMKTGDKEKIEKDGFSMLELKRFGDARGYVVQGFKITKPEAIVEIKLPFLTLMNSRGYDHFVIVKGTRDGLVYIADPAFGNRSRTIDEFKAEWSQVILVYLSKTRSPKNKFELEAGIRAPTGQVVRLVDQYLTRIRPSENGF